MWRLLVLLAVVGCAAGTTTRRTGGPGPADGRDDGRARRVVILVVIEGLPAWSFQEKLPALTRGFGRLLAEGEWRTGRTTSPIAPALAAATHPVTDAQLAGVPAWTPRDAAQLAQLSGTVDAQRGEVGVHGFGVTFPHDPAATTSPALAARATPHANQLALDNALAALDRESSIVVSLSAHALVAKGWGHESWEAWDMLLRLDEQLDAFVTALDKKLGADGWAMIVTSDHGGTRLPERARDGGRITVEQLQRAANLAASTNLGTGDWIAAVTPPYVTLTAAAQAANKRELANAHRKIVFALRAFPGIAIADRTDAYAPPCERRNPTARDICLAIERRGDFVFFAAPGWVIESETDHRATTHGSLHDDDRTVPVILVPFGRARHAVPSVPAGEISLGELAPLLTSWLR